MPNFFENCTDLLFSIVYRVFNFRYLILILYDKNRRSKGNAIVIFNIDSHCESFCISCLWNAIKYQFFSIVLQVSNEVLFIPLCIFKSVTTELGPCDHFRVCICFQIFASSICSKNRYSA